MFSKPLSSRDVLDPCAHCKKPNNIGTWCSDECLQQWMRSKTDIPRNPNGYFPSTAPCTPLPESPMQVPERPSAVDRYQMVAVQRGFIQ